MLMVGSVTTCIKGDDGGGRECIVDQGIRRESVWGA